jgi:hypothetical protein
MITGAPSFTEKNKNENAATLSLMIVLIELFSAGYLIILLYLSRNDSLSGNRLFTWSVCHFA